MLAPGAHALAGLVPLPFVATQIAVRRGALALKAHNGESFPTLLAPHPLLFHGRLSFSKQFLLHPRDATVREPRQSAAIVTPL